MSSAYESEARLEYNLIEQLVKQGYERVIINNEQNLLDNFRKQVNKFNLKRLDGIELSDREFDRLVTIISGKGVFNSAKELRQLQSITRDNGKTIFIELFNSKQWCKNLFQITNQTTVIGKYTSRYDVTILINGLPLVQIELKRRGLDFKEAFNQIQRYRKHSFTGLYRYIQLFVISNGVDTKYFSNGDSDLNFSHTFHWTDVKNERISNLSDFAFYFLDKCHISKMIARYMVLNETDKALMIMRPYQVYATEEILNRATETNNNGYVWHTTGSGKTLTSFKTSQLLKDEPNINKVFFLVDRKDLDGQTLEEFNKFDPGCVDTTDKTDTLVKQIEDPAKNLIITTIQKMANAIKNPRYNSILEKYKNEKVIFIIDECHRSQFGEMHKVINVHFEKAQYFGFTGTPRFIENKAIDGRTTADIFEKCLHTYLIKDAIKDENVLGFSVDYVSTTNYKEGLEDKRVEAIDTEEALMADERIAIIANNIVDIHNTKTRNRMYNAIFAVQSIPMLVKYYDMFKSINQDLKISAIFTYGNNEDSEGRDEHSRDSLERIIKDYNKLFNRNYSTDTFESYFKDVTKKVKSGEIDILLVVNMFLTGFDSKRLNTLYVDKKLNNHNLIQAFSRTNRVELSTKPYGNIICYQTGKKAVDEAITLFSQTNNVDTVLMKNYDEYLEQFEKALSKLKKIAPTLDSINNLEREEDKREFVLAFREVARILVKLETFPKFNFESSVNLISSQEYQDYRSKYTYLARQAQKDEETILDDIDFELELMRTDKINVSYILDLIKNLDLSNKETLRKDINDIEDKIDKTDNEELRLKSELIKNFLNKVVPVLDKDKSIDEAYNNHLTQERVREIERMAKEYNISYEKLSDFIEEFEYSGVIPIGEINKEIELPFLQKIGVVQSIKDFIINTVKKYM
jgi:type I restriction enzyme R subunit